MIDDDWNQKIAGTSRRRLRDRSFDIQLATVVDDEGRAYLWCIGCYLTGHRELFLNLEEVQDHILDHGHPGQRS